MDKHVLPLLFVVLVELVGCSSPSENSTNRGKNPVAFVTYSVGDGLASSNVNRVLATSSTVWAATGSPRNPISPGGLSYSTNGGKVWSTYDAANAPDSEYCVTVSATGNTIYASSFYNGLSYSIDNGETWAKLGLPGVTFDVAVGPTIYVATDEGLFSRSTGATNWTDYHNFRNGLTESDVLCVAIEGSSVYAGMFLSGMAISHDNGNTWSIQTTDNGIGGSTVRRIVCFGSSVFAATDGGLSISDNGGTSWNTVSTKSGLASNNLNDVYVDAKVILVATGSGLSFSNDGGSTWTTYTQSDGLGSNVVNSVSVTNGVVYAGTSMGVSVGVLPQ